MDAERGGGRGRNAERKGVAEVVEGQSGRLEGEEEEGHEAIGGQLRGRFSAGLAVPLFAFPRLYASALAVGGGNGGPKRQLLRGRADGGMRRRWPSMAGNGGEAALCEEEYIPILLRGRRHLRRKRGRDTIDDGDDDNKKTD